MARLASALAISLLLSGCGADASLPPPLEVKGSDISQSAEFQAAPRKLALTDHNGRPVTLGTFKGKAVVLFGYTHCPDVCPTTLSDMAQALKLLPADAAAKVQVLFVSVDPQRDTPELLKSYVPYFPPGFSWSAWHAGSGCQGLHASSGLFTANMSKTALTTI